MSFGTDDHQATHLIDPFSQNDISASTRHICSDGHFIHETRFRDDLSFPLMMFCIEYIVRNPSAGQCGRNRLRILDRNGSNQHGATDFILFFDTIDDSIPFFAGRAINDVGLVITSNDFFRRNLDDF